MPSGKTGLYSGGILTSTARAEPARSPLSAPFRKAATNIEYSSAGAGCTSPFQPPTACTSPAPVSFAPKGKNEALSSSICFAKLRQYMNASCNCSGLAAIRLTKFHYPITNWHSCQMSAIGFAWMQAEGRLWGRLLNGSFWPTQSKSGHLRRFPTHTPPANPVAGSLWIVVGAAASRICAAGGCVFSSGKSVRPRGLIRASP